MIKDKMQLVMLLDGVRKNNLESLDLLHYHFNNFIKKYAYKYNVDIETLNAEFDYIILHIINKNITDYESILSYLTICFKHFKNLNIDKFFLLNSDLSSVNLEKYINVLSDSTSVENEFFQCKFPRLSKVISADMIEILEKKFIDKSTCKEIGSLHNNISKQRISQKILKAKAIIEKELNYNK